MSRRWTGALEGELEGVPGSGQGAGGGIQVCAGSKPCCVQDPLVPQTALLCTDPNRPIGVAATLTGVRENFLRRYTAGQQFQWKLGLHCEWN